MNVDPTIAVDARSDTQLVGRSAAVDRGAFSEIVSATRSIFTVAVRS